MSAHVSIFDVKRFTEERLGADELPSFEQHLSACAACAAKLQQAATRALGLRGLLPLPEPSSASRPFAAGVIALAASLLFFLSLGQGPVHFPTQARSGVAELENGTPMQPLGVPVIGASAAVDGGLGSLAFHDGGPRRQ